jgi:hypothetical protein
VRGAFDALDKGFPIFDIKTLERRIEDALSRERLVADLSAVRNGDGKHRDREHGRRRRIASRVDPLIALRSE